MGVSRSTSPMADKTARPPRTPGSIARTLPRFTFTSRIFAVDLAILSSKFLAKRFQAIVTTAGVSKISQVRFVM